MTMDTAMEMEMDMDMDTESEHGHLYTGIRNCCYWI
jgi:hypothetical protein